MISQYQINNDLVDTTSSAYPSIYIQNQQNNQNQSVNSNSTQDPSSSQSPWAEANSTNAQSFLSNNSYLLSRQQIPASAATRTQLPSGHNSYRSQFASSSAQTQQKFANYIAQQNYHYLQNQNSNPSIAAQIVTYPPPLSSLQQQIHSTTSAAVQKYPAMYTSPSTNASYSLPLQQQNVPSNQSKFF